MPGIPGAKLDSKTTKAGRDKYAGRHVKAELLEDITPEIINRFIATCIQEDCWAPKTANLMRQSLHKLFSFASKHYGFRPRDRRYSNPAKAVDRRKEPASDIRFLKPDEIEVQLSVLEKKPLIHAMVSTYIYAGLRREEAIWLTKEDVDLVNRLIRLKAKTIDNEFWQ